MARFNLIQTNFTAGELSPRMYGRVDVARYNSGAKRIENCVVLIHGGCLRRPGLLYVAPTKTHSLASRLLPYIFNVEQAYQLEFGNAYMRVYDNTGAQIESSPGVPYEISSPYAAADLHEVDFCQGADTMFLFHAEYPTQRLQRFGNTDWRLQPVPWVTEPFDEIGTRYNVALTLSSAAVGAGRTVTAAGATFVAADVGRDLEWAGGSGTITGYTSTTVVTMEIKSAFQNTAVPGNAWLLTGSPFATVTPSADSPVGTIITLTASAAAWRTDDVGRHVVLNGGLVKITGYTSPTVVSAEIRVELSSTVAVIGGAWALCRSMWGQEFDYPRTGSLHQQRLWAGGSPGFPDTLWMSRLGQVYDMEVGTEPDAGYAAGVYSDQANPIRHLAAVRALAVLSYGAEFTVRSSGDTAAITPTSLQIDNQSAYGCNEVAPVRVGNELLFPDRSGRKIRAMSADRFDASNFSAPDITALAEHITESGICDMDAQAEPESIVWCVRNDGVIAACTLDRDNDVVAWARQITDGAFESVSVIPSGTSQQVWAIVRREIDGNTLRNVEIFTFDCLTDSAVIVENGVAFSVVNGLDHLEGKTVNVRADGVVQADKVVTGGSITLTRPANAVEVGLNFVPLVETMTPEVAGPNGSIQGLMMRAPEVTLRVKDTIGAAVNGRAVVFAEFGETLLDQPIPPYTGNKRVELLGYERGESELIITQPQALPFHLLAVVRRLEVNDG